MQNFHLERFISGSGVPTLNRNDVHPEQIINVPLPEQNLFAAFAQQILNDIKKINLEKEKIISERELAISKYFR